MRVELRVGPAANPLQTETWEASAKLFEDIPTDRVAVKYALPAAEWTGRDVVIGGKIFSENGRTAGWSNLVTLSVGEAPLPTNHGHLAAGFRGVPVAGNRAPPPHLAYPARAGEA